MTTPEHLMRRRKILEREDLLPMSYNIELASTAHPDSGAISYKFANVSLQAAGHPVHAPRLPRDIMEGLRRMRLDNLDYLAVNPTQVAFESAVYLCTIEADEVDEPHSWIFCFLLRIIAAFHHETPAGSHHWLDPAAWYACAIAASSAERAALLHGARRLQARTLATKMAEYEFGSRRHETIVLEVAEAYSSAFKLFGTIIEHTCTFLATTTVRSGDLARAHTFPFLRDGIPDAVLGSARRRSAYTPERRQGPTSVMQPRASSTWPGAASSSSAEPQEPKSMSTFDPDTSDEEAPTPPTRKRAVRDFLRRPLHKRSASGRSQQ
ncbi:hypothetical protein JCM8208_004115 [Rhodotorula glutinis]